MKEKLLIHIGFLPPLEGINVNGKSAGTGHFMVGIHLPFLEAKEINVRLSGILDLIPKEVLLIL